MSTEMPTLELAGLRAAYGVVPALHGVSLKVMRGQVVTLIGANGAGKSTVLKCISGLLRSTRDAVRLYGAPVGGLAPNELVARGLALVPEGRRLFGAMSVRDNLELGAFLRPGKERIAQGLERCLALFPDLQAKLDVAAGSLSGGQQQMVAVGRALMASPRILLLDEPTIGLAPAVVDLIAQALRTISREGVDVLLVEQNAEVALTVADYGYVLESGAIAAEAPAGELMRNDEVRRAYMGL
ncbi:ABC transporter ATP-binding protein [Achromobacter xylosoxidans]|uniref:ABC transporter ATP-binding protein n=1 Tax=Alcaligenes xylosoxydans xylosoxydans TaxID=85698 RepID=UPI00066847EB|nr:ABC transporter ATP-binding protein [Achromobacter xylosoxidans]